MNLFITRLQWRNARMTRNAKLYRRGNLSNTWTVSGPGHTDLYWRDLNKLQSPSGDLKPGGLPRQWKTVKYFLLINGFFAWSYLICDSSHYQGLQIKSTKLSALELDGPRGIVRFPLNLRLGAVEHFLWDKSTFLHQKWTTSTTTMLVNFG